jgi:quinol monooxygenase YgiN
MIHVVATIDVQPGRREEFLGEFRRIVPAVRAEEGCLEYGPTVDARTPITTQPAVRENVVVVVEKWASVAALEKHMVAPHMQDYRVRVKPLVAKVALQILEPA